MNIKKNLTLLLLALIFVSTSLAQEKKVIIKKVHPGEDMELNHVFIDHDSVLSDKALKNIAVKVLNTRQAKARIVIKKSGFFSKKKIIIDFDPTSKKILNVNENGKDISENKFHKYQEYLEDATDMAELEELHPRMEELEWNMLKGELADSLKLADIETILVKLESMDSDLAHMKKKQFISQKHIIELGNLEEIIQQTIEAAGGTPPQKIKEIEIKNGMFFINGDEIEGEIGQKCIQAYGNASGYKVEGMQKKGSWHDKDMQIKIILD